jgi:cytochrome bd ubiquinol oxidase subunit II
LLVGITTVALFMMHGAIYLVMKTEGDLHERIRGWVQHAIIFFAICYVTTTMATLLYVPDMARQMRAYPVLFVIPVLTMLAIANVPREIAHRRDFNAFLSSCAAIILLVAMLAIGLFPDMLHSTLNRADALSIYNSASSTKTLWIMLVIALLGMPLVIGYTVGIYWIFRGKTKLDASSY